MQLTVTLMEITTPTRMIHHLKTTILRRKGMVTQTIPMPLQTTVKLMIMETILQTGLQMIVFSVHMNNRYWKATLRMITKTYRHNHLPKKKKPLTNQMLLWKILSEFHLTTMITILIFKGYFTCDRNHYPQHCHLYHSLY